MKTSKKIIESKSDKLVIIIDDLERFEGDIHTLLGTIDEMLTINGVHVIYIGNETVLNAKTDFGKIKEKFIRYTIGFTNDLNVLLEDLAQTSTATTQHFARTLKRNRNSQRLVSWLEKTGIDNIRSIKTAIECFEEILNIRPIHDPHKALYFFLALLTHVEFVKSGAFSSGIEFQDFLKKMNLQKADYFFTTSYLASNMVFSSFVESKLLINLITTGQIDVIRIGKYIEDTYLSYNTALAAYDKVMRFLSLEEDEATAAIEDVLEGIRTKELPYSYLPGIAQEFDFIHIYNPSLIKVDYASILMNAVRDDSYTGKDEYDGLPRYEASKSYPTYNLVINAINEEAIKTRERKKELFPLLAFLEHANDDNSIFDTEDYEIEPNLIFLLEKYNLFGRLDGLTEKGLFNCLDMSLQYALGDREPKKEEIVALTHLEEKLIQMKAKAESSGQWKRSSDIMFYLTRTQLAIEEANKTKR